MKAFFVRLLAFILSNPFLQALIVLSNGLVVAYAGHLPIGTLLTLAVLGIWATLFSKRVLSSGAPATLADQVVQVIGVLAQAVPAGAASLHDACVAAQATCASYVLPPWVVVLCAAGGGLFGMASHGLAARNPGIAS
jgi:hypothetical protein